MSRLLSKLCVKCPETFAKPSTCSKKAWAIRQFCSKRCAYDARKGKPSWNAGIKTSTIPEYAKMGFQKGHPRFTKNLHRFTFENIRKAHATQKRNGTEGGRGIKRPSITGVKHPLWKGGYQNQLWLCKRRTAMKKGAIGRHTRQQWNEVKARFDHQCPGCERYEPEIVLTEDHIVPLSKGGSDHIDNIQPLCRACNTRKYANVVEFVPVALFA